MRKLITVLFYSTIIFSFAVYAQKAKPKSDEANIFLNYSKLIDTREIKADEKFLASDELEGREMGERGINIAALYLKTQFEKIGLTPLNNSYFQKFKVIKTPPAIKPVLIIENTQRGLVQGEYKKDFFPISTGSAPGEISSKIVFAGYGITSPENNYDDYKNIDAKDKIVLIIANSPQEDNFNTPFSSKAYSYRQYTLKIENALKHGAIGVLYMMEVGNKTLNLYIKSFGNFINRSDYKMLNGKDKNSIPMAYITKDFANKILRYSGKTIESLKTVIDDSLTNRSFEILNTSITFKPGIKRQILETQNVVGFLEGTDPELKNQIIVFSCHYDHLGKTADGKIFNGADDNASGTTGILNIAKSYLKNDQKPSRSMLFIAFTGEEKGLFGSNFYSENPIFPFKNTFLDLNLDMIGRIDTEYVKKGIKKYIYLIGPKIMGGDLFELSAKANKESSNLVLDYKYDDIKDPEIIYRRSDHYNFAKHKIPTIFFYSGEHKDYHKITDKVDKIDFEIMTNRIELIGYTGWKFANYKNLIKTERSFP